MKNFVRLSLLPTLFLSSSVFALNPVLGFYGGLFGQGSRGNTNTDFMFTHDGMPYNGELKYNVLGGGGGLELGYKFQHFRLEIEGFYNTNSYAQLKINDCTLESPTVTSPTGTCPANFVTEGLAFNGDTSVLLAMGNAFFDFYSADSESVVVPYIGFGVGAGQVRNTDRFIGKNTNTEFETNRNSSVSSAQAIIGVSYYMDDYAWASFDYRYITTNAVDVFNNSRYGINSLNISVNMSFSKG